jgi:glycosyltransferase involved in cell wall biosynthesis
MTDLHAPHSRLLVIAYDKIGPRMAGPGVRSWEIAKALASDFDVTVASGTPIERTASGVTCEHVTTDERMAELVEQADAVLVQGMAYRRYRCLHTSRVILVVDLYDPWVLENLEQHAVLGAQSCTEHLLADADVQNELIDAGDVFICASERQRDYWLGMLTSRGKLDHSAWLDDPELRSLIDVVPYGAPADAPAASAALKGVHPSVAADDIVLLWSGGAWQWFDPLLVVDAFAAAVKQAPRLRLYFMGLAMQGSVPAMPIAKALHERARELDLHTSHIIFGDWVPYDDRGAVLAEADAAVLATRRSVEARLAFRSRLLDHFWVGLPTVTTPGDVLSEFVGEHGAGIIVPIGDQSAMTEAMLRIGAGGEDVQQMRAAARALADEFRWADNVEPLRQIMSNLDRVRVRRQRSIDHLELTGAQVEWRGGRFSGHLPRTLSGFHQRGPVIDRLKRSGLYPLMRWVRRTWLGRKIWGAVPGE